MSLQAVANHMASQGRGPDTMLVHMAPSEVKGLQALAMAHGGSLTINPQTGLPEAGFLASILPMVAGAFLGPAGAGLFGSALTAGLGVGAITGAATGSLRKGLMAGLGAYGGAGLMGSVMGAGAQGAAGAGAGAGGFAPTVFPDQLMPGAGAAPAIPDAAFLQPSAATAPAASVSPEVQNLLSRYPAPMEAPVAPIQTTPAPVTPTPMPAPTPVDVSAPMPGEDMARTMPQQVGKFDQFRSGIDAVMKDPKQFFNKENMKYGLAALAPMMLSEPEEEKRKKDEAYRYSYSPGRTNADLGGPYTSEARYFNPSYTRLAADGGTMSSEYDYVYDPATQLYKRKEEVAPTPKTPSMSPFADMGVGGGSAAPQTAPGDPSHPLYGLLSPIGAGISLGLGALGDVAQIGMGMVGNAVQGKQSGANVPVGDAGSYADYMAVTQSPFGSYGENVAPGSDYAVDVAAAADANTTPESTFASGGISHLGDYSDGGRLLRGPGDGVSDDIPATIANKRPARLADGEFVVPARIVSELGNGSTEAGARKLYAMMDRIQKNRAKTVGKGKVAVNSRSDKLLPA